MAAMSASLRRPMRAPRYVSNTAPATLAAFPACRADRSPEDSDSDGVTEDSGHEGDEGGWRHTHHPLLPCLPECPEYARTAAAPPAGLDDQLEEWEEVGAKALDTKTLQRMSVDELNLTLCRLAIEERVALQDIRRAYSVEKDRLTRLVALHDSDHLDRAKAQRQAAIQRRWQQYRMGMVTATAADPVGNPEDSDTFPKEFMPPSWFHPIEHHWLVNAPAGSTATATKRKFCIKELMASLGPKASEKWVLPPCTWTSVAQRT